VTIRFSARVAGLALVGAEATAVLTHAGARPPGVVWFAFLALQAAAVVWVTDPRSAPALRALAPALFTAVTAAAVWTAFAFAVPAVATTDGLAVVVICATGLVVAAADRGAGRRLPRVLLAAAAGALLIFLVIASLLPVVPGFVGNSYPPTSAPVVRLVDPIGEFALFVVLAVAFGIDLLRTWTRARRTAARGEPPEYGGGPNEMVVERIR
jgi:hypothetical protein